MNKELEKKLIERFPNLFKDIYGDPLKTCMAWGMEHRDGWFNILWELCEKIEKFDGYFIQIKEKYGTLRTYYSGPSEADQFIDEAEKKSSKTCEICGEEGKTRGGGWLVTLCKKHAENEGIFIDDLT